MNKKYFVNFYKYSQNKILTPDNEQEIQAKDIFKVNIPKNADLITLYEKDELIDGIYSNPKNVDAYCIGTSFTSREIYEKFGEASTQYKYIQKHHLKNAIIMKSGNIFPLSHILNVHLIDKDMINENGKLSDFSDNGYLDLE